MGARLQFLLPAGYFLQVFPLNLLLLGLDLMPFLHAITHRTLWADMGVLWPPLLLGALVLGLIAAASGYVLAQAVWRAHVIYQLRRRRARSSGRGIALD